MGLFLLPISPKVKFRKTPETTPCYLKEENRNTTQEDGAVEVAFVKKWGWGKRGALHSPYLTAQSLQSQ